MQQIRVWDLPTRVFHGLLFLGVLVTLITGEEGEEGVLSIHQIFGFLVMALLIFRVIWGIVGTRHARFASFIRGPATVLPYMRALLRFSPPASLGHNPLGAWMVVLLLVDLVIVVGTGLFAGKSEDDGEDEAADAADEVPLSGLDGDGGEGAGEGAPFADLVSPGTADFLSGVHAVFANLLIALIVIHVLGVLLDWLLTRDNVVRAMITGEKTMKPEFEPAQAIKSSRLYLAIPLALIAIGLTCYVAVLG